MILSRGGLVTSVARQLRLQALAMMKVLLVFVNTQHNIAKALANQILVPSWKPMEYLKAPPSFTI